MIWVILFPAFYLMAKKKIFSGIICLFLQISVLGWVIAIFWANAVRKEGIQEKQHKELMASMANGNQS